MQSKKNKGNTAKNFAEDIMADVESIGRDMSHSDYVGFLQELKSRISANLDAAAEDARG